MIRRTYKKKKDSPPWAKFAPSTSDRRSPQWATVRFLIDSKYVVVKIGPNAPREIPEHLAKVGSFVEVWRTQQALEAEIIFTGSRREAEENRVCLSSEQSQRVQKKPMCEINDGEQFMNSVTNILDGDDRMTQLDPFEQYQMTGINRAGHAPNIASNNAQIGGPIASNNVQGGSHMQDANGAIASNNVHGGSQYANGFHASNNVHGGSHMQDANGAIASNNVQGGSHMQDANGAIASNNVQGGSQQANGFHASNNVHGGSHMQDANGAIASNNVHGGSQYASQHANGFHASNNVQMSRRRETNGNVIASRQSNRKEAKETSKRLNQSFAMASSPSDFSSDESNVSAYVPTGALKTTYKSKKGKKTSKGKKRKKPCPTPSPSESSSSNDSDDDNWMPFEAAEVDVNLEANQEGVPNNVRVVTDDDNKIQIVVSVKDYGRRKLTSHQCKAYLKLQKMLRNNVYFPTVLRSFYKAFFPNWKELTLSRDPRAQRKRIRSGLREVFFTCLNELTFHTQAFVVDHRHRESRPSQVTENRRSLALSLNSVKSDSKEQRKRKLFRLAFCEPDILQCRCKITRAEQQGAACRTCFIWLCNAHAAEHKEKNPNHLMCIVHKIQAYP